MNILELHDQHVRAEGLRGLLVAVAMLAGTIGAGAAIVTAPVEVVAKGTVEHQQSQSDQKIATLRHRLDGQDSQLNKQAKDLRILKDAFQSCFAPSAVCSPTIGEPMLVTNRSTDGKDHNNTTTRIVRETRTTQQVPVKTPETKQSDNPTADTVDKTAKTVSDAVADILKQTTKATGLSK